jgi:tetratricopeptide (TPR) repeat protein
MADRKVSAGLPAKQRMRLEERLVRRCYELKKDDLAVARASSIPGALLDDPSIDAEVLADFKLYWAYALNRQGRRAHAARLWNEILQRTHGDPRLYPNYAACVGLTLLQSGDKARGLALVEEAIELNPTDPTASFGRLYLAWDAIENGRIDSAKQHASDAKRYATPSAGKRWQRETYWSAQLLDGYLKQRAGDASGKRIMAEALEHEVLDWVADRVAQGTAP